jgi:hypothetical protein
VDIRVSDFQEARGGVIMVRVCIIILNEFIHKGGIVT